MSGLHTFFQLRRTSSERSELEVQFTCRAVASVASYGETRRKDFYVASEASSREVLLIIRIINIIIMYIKKILII